LPRCRDRQVAQAAAIVEDVAAKIGQGDPLERIELQVGRAHLLLELGIEETNAGAGIHR
jgi:hypothetical protein